MPRKVRHVRSSLQYFGRGLGEAPAGVRNFETQSEDDFATRDFAADVCQVVETEIKIARFLITCRAPRRLAGEQPGALRKPN